MFSAVLRDRLQIRKQGEKWQENHMETIALSWWQNLNQKWENTFAL